MPSIEGSQVRKLVIACDAGMGSSVLMANQLKKRLKGNGVDDRAQPDRRDPGRRRPGPHPHQARRPHPGARR